jgi:hypothetical protein
MSYQAVLENRTPFRVLNIVLPDEEGQEVILIVVSASFVAGPDGMPLVAQEHTPVRTGDQYLQAATPARSSILREADLALSKAKVDVVLNGHAWAPEGRPTPRVPVLLSVGSIRKVLTVTGDRHRASALRGHALSMPVPFRSMPIVYERARGGSVFDDAGKLVGIDRRNPAGIGLELSGHAAARSSDPSVDSDAPNVEYADASLAGSVAGFGFVSRGWSPRLEQAGTFDGQWLDERWPFMPANFDKAHYQGSPPDQQCDSIAGETVTLRNLTPDGLWQFRLPKLDIPVLLTFTDRLKWTRPRMDTIVIDADARRVDISLRLALRTLRDRGRLVEIFVGMPSRALLLARKSGKAYLDHRPVSMPPHAEPYVTL